MNSLLTPKPVGTVLLNAGLSPILTSGWTVIAANVVKAASCIQIFNTTGSTLAISTGAPGLESGAILPYTILQGSGDILIDIIIPSGVPLSIKALDAASSSGLLVINLFG